ncbi:MAG TPA: radical SAM protein, partial [Pseudothermotoga sp.]
EPGAPSVEERFETLRKLKEAGIDVSVFVGPVIVMDAEHLAYMLSKYVDRVMLDALNYHRQVQTVYEKYGWADWLTKDRFLEVVERFERVFGKGSVRY